MHQRRASVDDALHAFFQPRHAFSGRAQPRDLVVKLG